MKHWIILFFLFAATALGAQPKTYDDSITARLSLRPRQYQLPDGKPFGETITAANMKYLIDTLASDAMAGRETGEPGQRMAADFIAEQFRALGLPQVADRKTYFQNIFLKRESWTDIGLKVDGKEFKNRTDFYVYPVFNDSRAATPVKEIVFVGYGIEDGKYSDYGKTDVKGKAVIFYDGEPMDKDGRSLVTGREFRSSWSLDWNRKVQLATQKGAAMVFIIDPELTENVKTNRRKLSSWGWEPAAPNAGSVNSGLANSIFVSQDVANAFFGKKSDKVEEACAALRNGSGFKPLKIKTTAEVRLAKEIKTLEGSNVVGLIEGADPDLKNEYVIITAHYDHLGEAGGVVYNGADDNASGTSGVIEIARAFAKAKAAGVGPKRSVVCMLVSGEEKGLLGSKFYVEFPIFPLERTVANVNIDMIGRLDNRHADNPDYIYVIGSNRMSTELHEVNEFANAAHTKLELDYKYNDPKDPNRYYERSDHYNFAERGIPAIFYFNGTHADYHKETDTADKIDVAAAAKRARLAFYTAWDIANRPTRIAVDVKK
ncbi:MAG: M28 family peptidase [Lewinellaceae bacterium]|nr:M28 family peptidase [Lewinellaceae bacterium]